MANASDVAAQYGYSVAFFNSDPELKRLLDQAVKGNWNPSQFVAKLQATKWFKTKGEAARQMFALKTSDPATFNQRVATARQQIASVAWQLGAPVPGGAMAKLAEQALTLGWNDEQIKAAVSPYIKAGKDGLYKSGAAAAQMQLRELASDYGYSLSPKQSGEWIKGIVTGQTSIEQVKQTIIANTMSKFPGLKDRLGTGETLEQIAAPYKDSYSKLLEVNPETITLRDPMITRALASKDKDGKPTTATIWQFEENLKKDKRWLSTNNARDELVGNTRKVLQDFGLVN